jgi:hypothetical protein
MKKIDVKNLNFIEYFTWGFHKSKLLCGSESIISFVEDTPPLSPIIFCPLSYKKFEFITRKGERFEQKNRQRLRWIWGLRGAWWKVLTNISLDCRKCKWNWQKQYYNYAETLFENFSLKMKLSFFETWIESTKTEHL